MEMEESEGFTVLSYVPINVLIYGQPKTTYTLVKIEDNSIGK